MKKNFKAESLAGIVVGVFILSFVIIGIGTVIGNSKELMDDADRKLKKDLLYLNTFSVLEHLDLSSLNDGDKFYLYKDTSNFNFEIKTGATNEEYKFVNEFGEKVSNVNTYTGTVFSLELNANKKVFLGKDKVFFDIYLK